MMNNEEHIKLPDKPEQLSTLPLLVEDVEVSEHGDI